MRKLLLLFSLLLSLTCEAQEFKIGDAKYKVIGTGEVSLVDYKKAIGNITLKSSVTDPKSKQSYTLTTIGKKAFQGSKIESVVMSNSINKIEPDAFQKCKLLESVTLSSNLTEIPDGCFAECIKLSTIDLLNSPLEVIGIRAFKKSGLNEITIPATVNEIKVSAFFECPNLRQVVFAESLDPNFEMQTLKIAPGAFYGDPISILGVSSRKCVLNKVEGNPTLIYTPDEISNIRRDSDYLWAFYGTDIQYVVFGKKWPTIIPAREFEDISFKTPGFFNFLDFKDVTFVCPDVDKSYNLGQLKPIWREMKVQNLIIDGKTMSPDQYFKQVENSRYLEKLENAFANYNKNVISGESRGSLYDIRRCVGENKFQTVEGADSIYNIYTIALADSLLKLPTLNEVQQESADALVGDLIYGRSLAYVNKKLSYYEFFDNDILRKEIANGNSNPEDYYRILAIAEKAQKYKKDPNIIIMMFQIVGLCGIEEYKKAAAYWPKVHRTIHFTEFEEKYDCLKYMNYLKDFLNEQGCKIAEPNYAKNAKASKADGAAALLELFIGSAIEDRINRIGEEKPKYRYDDSKYLKDVKPSKK